MRCSRRDERARRVEAGRGGAGWSERVCFVVGAGQPPRAFPPGAPPKHTDLALFVAVCPALPSSAFAQSSVVSVCASMDGLKLAVGTSAGSIGVLDVMTHGYTTALRSHRGGVTAAAVDPDEERAEFATVSEDCTIR